MEQPINKSSKILKCLLTPDLNQFRYQVKETFMYGKASLSHPGKVANESEEENQLSRLILCSNSMQGIYLFISI